MFKLKTDKPTDFRNIVKCMEILADEVTLEITPEKIGARCMDPSRVAMFDIEVAKEFFTEYECSEQTKICLNLRQFLKLLGRASVKDRLELSLSETTLTHDKFQLTILSKDNKTRKFNFPMLEPQEEGTPTPKIAFTVKASMTLELLHSALEDAQIVSDHVRFEIEPAADKLILSAAGDLMDATVELKKDMEDVFTLDMSTADAVRSTFSLSYIVEIVKTAKAIGSVTTIELAKDMPIKIEVQNIPGKLVYHLAPRIEVD